MDNVHGEAAVLAPGNCVLWPHDSPGRIGRPVVRMEHPSELGGAAVGECRTRGTLASSYNRCVLEGVCVWAVCGMLPDTRATSK